MRVLILLAALTGCAGTGAGFEQREREAFAQDLAGRVAGPPEDCVSITQNVSLHPIDRHTLVYERGPVTWVNRLSSACPGVRPLSTVIVEVHGGQYCRGDRIRALEPGSTIPGGACLLGQFTPYRQAGR